MFILYDAVGLNMGTNNTNPGKPDSWNEPRIPANDIRLGKGSECAFCEKLVTTTFDLGGHTGDPCCPSCFATLYDIPDKLWDDYENFLFSNCNYDPIDHNATTERFAQIHGLILHGSSHTLGCGCIITDLKDGSKWIELCELHRMLRLDLYIVLESYDIPCPDCGCQYGEPITDDYEPCWKCAGGA